MTKYNLLILTDHSNHSSENSLYFFVSALKANPACNELAIASRGISENTSFFNGDSAEHIYVTKAADDFKYAADGFYFSRNLQKEKIAKYHFIWLRMPPPMSKSFLYFLNYSLKDQIILNDPKGIFQTGSKEFLINFSELCPPLKICKSIEDIIEFKNEFPIVLKPFRDYGGNGIVRISGEEVWEGLNQMTFTEFAKKIENTAINYLGVKYLQKVSEGDKRIVVVDGKIMGASLRLPKEGSWICNVAMGGTSNIADVDEDEKLIVETINPSLSKMGITMYGVDTLMGDENKRVLSELNTTSIGGLPQIAKLLGKPLVEEAAHLIWQKFIHNYLNKLNAIKSK